MSSRTYRHRPPQDGGTNRRHTNVCRTQPVHCSSHRLQHSNYYDILHTNHQKTNTITQNLTPQAATSDLRDSIHRPHFLHNSRDDSQENYLDEFTLITKYRNKSKRHKRINYSYIFKNSQRSHNHNDPKQLNVYRHSLINKENLVRKFDIAIFKSKKNYSLFTSNKLLTHPTHSMSSNPIDPALSTSDALPDVPHVSPESESSPTILKIDRH